MTITCPHCGFSKEIAPETVPERPVKVTCPKCRAAFTFNGQPRQAQEAPATVEPAMETTAVAAPEAAGGPGPRRTCPACGLEQPEGESCLGCGVIFARLEQRQQEQPRSEAPLQTKDNQPAHSAETLPKAGFWIRVGAALLDSLAVAILQFTLTLLLNFLVRNVGNGTSEFQVALGTIISLFTIAVSVGYYVFFTGYCGQTPGKMAVRIKVIRTDGSDLGYGRAFFREVVGKFVSGILLMIGYLMVAFDNQKQGLHDRIADTYVIKL